MASDLDLFLLKRSAICCKNRNVNFLLGENEDSSSLLYFETHYLSNLKCFNSHPIDARIITLKMIPNKSSLVKSTVSLLEYYRNNHEFSVLQFNNESNDTSESTTINAINSVALDSVNNEYLLSGSNNGKIQVYNTENSELVADISSSIGSIHESSSNNQNLNGHRFAVSIVKWWPFDTGMFLTGLYDKSIKVWDTESLQLIHTIQNDKIIPKNLDLELLENFNTNISNSLESRFGHIYSIAFSPVLQHGLLAIGSQGADYIKLFDMRTMSPASYLFEAKCRNSSTNDQSIRKFVNGSGSIVLVAWNPFHENIICSGSSSGSIKVWDIRKNNSFLYSLDCDYSNKQKEETSNKRNFASYSSLHSGVCHTSAVNGICWNGPSMIVSVGMDNIIKYWNVNDKNYSVVVNGNYSKSSLKKRKSSEKGGKKKQAVPSVIFSNSILRNINPVMIDSPTVTINDTDYSVGKDSVAYMSYFANDSFFLYKLSKNDVSSTSFFKRYQADSEFFGKYTSMDLTPKESNKLRFYFGTSKGNIATWGSIKKNLMDSLMCIT